MDVRLTETKRRFERAIDVSKSSDAVESLKFEVWDAFNAGYLLRLHVTQLYCAIDDKKAQLDNQACA